MKFIVFSIICLAFIFNLSSVTAQERAKKEKKKTEYNVFLWEDDFVYKGKPSIELSYGKSDISLKNYSNDFIRNGSINLKLGWHKERKTYNKNIVKYRSNFIGGTYSSGSLNPGSEISNEPVALGISFGSADGYGYRIWKNSSLVLYNSGSMAWTRYKKGLNPKTVDYKPGEYDKLEDFNNTFRFGTSAEGGVIIPIGGLFNILASYERTIVFPRHMVWKHMGSALIEAGGQSLIDGFVHAIYKSSPFAAPIVSFILKNGLSYGLYELRREKMNWPFESAEPLLFDTYKVGIKFTF